MKYMLIDTTAVEQTKVVAVSGLREIQLIGRILQAEGRTVVAPPLLGRGFAKLEKLPLQYLFWNTCNERPPEDYGELIRICMQTIDEMPVVTETVEQLEARCREIGLDLNSSRTEASGSPKAVSSSSGPVERPKGESTTGKVWVIADKLFAEHNGMPPRDKIMAACVEAGINPATAATQYSKWKKSKG
jgi:hypothetical protein